METKKISIFELVIFFLIVIIFNMVGYFSFWQGLTNNNTPDWQYFIFSTIFLVTLVSMLLFFRRTMININRIADEKIEIQQNYLDRLNNTYEGTLKALSYALDIRDHGTGGHSARVVSYALAIAEKIGLHDNELRQLAWAGLLHDIGKIGIPDSILLKSATLNPEEWENIKRHPMIGFEVIRGIDFLKFAADIVLCHHEHYDGSGYPRGIKGQRIPLEARIFAIADAIDAMTSNRPYRQACVMEKAIAEIKKEAGKQYCPDCVAALEKVGMDELKIIQQHVKNIGDVANLRRGLDPLVAFTKEY